MTIIEVIQKLQSAGYSVAYSKRKDGGYIIRKINGVHCSGKTGNAMGRKILGVSLSTARKVQLERIRTRKGTKASERKRTKLPAELVRELKRVQRRWRKHHPTIEGTIGMRGLRYQYENFGKEQALLALDKAFRYSEGYAYIENVQHLIDRINLDLNKEASPEMEEVRDLIEQRMMVFKEEWIQQCYQVLYDWETNRLSAEETARRIKLIIK